MQRDAERPAPAPPDERQPSRPSALSIAGFDPSGGAGALADVVTFRGLGVHGAACLTAITAQSTAGVEGVWPLAPEQVAAQLDVLCPDLRPRFAKTGMLATAALVEAVAEAAERHRLELVVDPVIVSSSGRALLDDDGVDRLLERLLPLAVLITPNVPEAERLTGQAIQTVEDQERAAAALVERGARAALVKGGHLGAAPRVVDVLATREGLLRLSRPAVSSDGSLSAAHGTGCALSAAICALLARDPARPLPQVCGAAGQFVASALRRAYAPGLGAPVLDLLGAASERRSRGQGDKATEARQRSSEAGQGSVDKGEVGGPAGSAEEDRRFMAVALEEAAEAATRGDVPVGAVLVARGEVVARASNRREADGDPTAHAELLVLRAAAAGQESWRLEDACLYVTLEPCFMCAGALVNARVGRLVYAAADEKGGAVASLAGVCTDPRLNHRLAVTGGVCEEEARTLLQAFFRARRAP